MSNVIKTTLVNKIYDMGSIQVEALKNASISIETGEFVSIMGPSGSGKSTLMHILGCLDQPTSGQYYLDGEEVSAFSKNKLAWVRNIKIGFVFQTFNLLPHLNILKNVELPLMYAGINSKKRSNIAKDLLHRLGLGDRLTHKPSELTGGQRQRVAIARAVINQPSIILADEPTGNLDSQSGSDILSIFKELHKQNNTIIMVTHDQNIANIANRIISLKDGEVLNGDLS
jgi:putative ABC transport system ATP-binding protein